MYTHVCVYVGREQPVPRMTIVAYCTPLYMHCLLQT